jgi:hypothetical protein
MRGGISFVVLLLLLSSVACSSDKNREGGQQTAPAPASAPSSAISGSDLSSAKAGGDLSLKITPESGTRGSIFSVISQGFGISDAKTEWSVNGKPVPASSPNQFKAENLRRDDTVQVTATINGKEIRSAPITIRNSAPEITDAKIVVESGSALSVEAAARDADGDDVTLQYEWTVNRSHAGSERRLMGTFKRGDYVTVNITPYDGGDYGRPVVLQRIFGNLSPVVRDDKRVTFDGSIYTYQISAIDPDGDTLTYSLKSGPPGMTVDASTGLVRWVVPKDFVGKTPARVVVSDGHGGETICNFNAIIHIEK